MIYYSQTDEQIKWINQVIKQYLREYIDYQQTNWVLLLSIAQLTYNISINAVTEQILFFINHKYNANMFLESKESTVLTEQVKVTVNEMHKLHKELQMNIKFLLHHSVFYHNQHCAGVPILKERNKVYLL